MIFSDEDKILTISLYLKGYTAKRLTEYLLNICRKFEFLISLGSVTACLR